MQTIHKFKKMSYGLLSKDRILHVGTIIAFGACFTALALLPGTVLPLLYQRISDVSIYLLDIFFFIFRILICIPLIYGLCVFEYNAVSGEKHSVKDLFYAYSSVQRYNRSLLLVYSLFWRFLLVFAPAIIFFYHFKLYSSGIYLYFKPVGLFGLDFTYSFLCSVFVFFCIIGFAIYSRYFTAIYLTVEYEDMYVSKCFLIAPVYNHGFKKKLFLTALSFLPGIILSIFTAGILLILHTLPMILLTFFNISKNLCDTQIKIENTTDYEISVKSFQE